MKKTLKLLALGFATLCMTIVLMNSPVLATGETPVTNGAELKTALEAGESVILSGNITDLSSTIEISDTVTINGAGNSIEVSTFKSIFKLYEGADVTFENITIRNTFADGRCIDVREGKTKLTLNKVILETTTTASNDGHDRPINVGGNFEEAIEINIKDSTILAGKAGYAIITFNPINLTIDNSKITGYAALYMKSKVNSAGSAGSIVKIINGSVLNGKNNNEPIPDNNFATIKMEDENITIEVVDSTIKATTDLDKAPAQFVFAEPQTGLTVGNKISVSGSSVIEAKKEDGIAPSVDNKTNVTVDTGVTLNVEVPETFLPKDVEIKDLGNGKFEIVETTFKVKIDDKEYVLGAGKTLKDISEYKSIISKDGYKFVEFQKAGVKWEENTVVESDIELTTVFEKIEEPPVGDDGEEGQPPVSDDGEEGQQPVDNENGQGVENDKGDKDKTPTTGIKESAFTIFAVVAIMVSVVALNVVKKGKRSK